MHAATEVAGRPVSARAPRRWDLWAVYLAFMVALTPIIMPIGPAQVAIADSFNVIALLCFTVAVFSRRIVPRIPFAIGALAILVGSMIAMVNAESVTDGIVALVQDAYLYVWFIMLVSVLARRGDLVGLRIFWVAVACGVAIYGFMVVASKGATSIGQIIGPKGARVTGTFRDPNMCADYLGMSLFIALSLSGHVGRVVRWGAIALLLAAIVGTKSNGGALSLFVGLVVWVLVRARTTRFPVAAIAGAALVAVSVVALAGWMATGLGVGTRQLREIQTHSFLARAGHSSEGRFKIWTQLERTLAKAPLGIGPGNSRWQSLTVEGRERPHSMYSKEAHSDYLAYAIERGPLAVLALLFLVWHAFAKIGQIWTRRVRAGTADQTTGALVAALAGALACSAVHSLTLERLHFRHFWLLLAVICALAEAPRARRAAQPSAPAAREKALEPLAAAHA